MSVGRSSLHHLAGFPHSISQVWPPSSCPKTPLTLSLSSNVRTFLSLHCCVSLSPHSQQQWWCPVAYLHPSFKHCALCQPLLLLLPPSPFLLLFLLHCPSLSPCPPKAFCHLFAGIRTKENPLVKKTSKKNPPKKQLPHHNYAISYIQYIFNVQMVRSVQC